MWLDQIYILFYSLRISGHLGAAKEIELEKCNFQNFRSPMTLILDRVIGHTNVHQSWTRIDIKTFIEIGKKVFFLDRLTAGTPPSSRSRDTKTRINIKNKARPNLDIVL